MMVLQDKTLTKEPLLKRADTILNSLDEKASIDSGQRTNEDYSLVHSFYRP